MYCTSSLHVAAGTTSECCSQHTARICWQGELALNRKGAHLAARQSTDEFRPIWPAICLQDLLEHLHRQQHT